MRTRTIVVFSAIAFTPLPVNAQDGGTPGAGYAYARANCSECHAIGRADAQSPNLDAPSFTSVAATPGMTGYALAAWLQTSHPTMPDLIIAADDQANLIAYILSLKPNPKLQ
jgi:mono/diheme cytochrome c family protein